MVKFLSFIPVKEELVHAEYHSQPIFRMAHKSALSNTNTVVEKGDEMTLQKDVLWLEDCM